LSTIVLTPSLAAWLPDRTVMDLCRVEIARRVDFVASVALPGVCATDATNLPVPRNIGATKCCDDAAGPDKGGNHRREPGFED
jgi:hypothetical protein